MQLICNCIWDDGSHAACHGGMPSGSGWFGRVPTPNMAVQRTRRNRHVRLSTTHLACRRPSTAWPGPISPRNRPSRSRWPRRRSSRCCCSASAKARPALLQTALTLPFILFAIPAGLLADRISRRWLMAGAEALRAAALLAILVLIWFRLLTLPLLALLGFIAVCGTVVYSVAAPALVPSLVSPQRCPPPMRGSNWRARWRLPAGRRSAAYWSDGSAPRPRSALPPRFRWSRWCCCRESTSRHAQPAPRRHPLQEIKEGAAFVLHHRCCGRCSSPSSSSTPRRSCCSRCSCPMRCAISACRRPASAPRWRCTASAWWRARCRRRG